MTTDNNSEVIPYVRDINVLLSLGTYQDMSDEEIESVIEFKINDAIANYEASETLLAIKAHQNSMIAEAAAERERSRALLEKIKNRNRYSKEV